MHVPTATLLHPLSAGGQEALVRLPLNPLNGLEEERTANDTGAIDGTEGAGGNVVGLLMIDKTDKNPAPEDTNAVDIPATPLATQTSGHEVGAAGRFASRIMGNVQRHLAKNEMISGTLMVSLELVDDHNEVGDGVVTPGGRHSGGGRGGALHEPLPTREPEGYVTMKFKVAEDAATEKRRRAKEGISVPRMLSRVAALHQKLEGDVTLRCSSGLGLPSRPLDPTSFTGLCRMCLKYSTGHLNLLARCASHISLNSSKCLSSAIILCV